MTARNEALLVTVACLVLYLTGLGDVPFMLAAGRVGAVSTASGLARRPFRGRRIPPHPADANRRRA